MAETRGRQPYGEAWRSELRLGGGFDRVAAAQEVEVAAVRGLHDVVEVQPPVAARVGRFGRLPLGAAARQFVVRRRRGAGGGSRRRVRSRRRRAPAPADRRSRSPARRAARSCRRRCRSSGRRRCGPCRARPAPAACRESGSCRPPASPARRSARRSAARAHRQVSRRGRDRRCGRAGRSMSAEDDRPAPMLHEGGSAAACLITAPSGREVAAQDGQCRLRLERIVERCGSRPRSTIRASRDILGQGLAGDGQRVAVEQRQQLPAARPGCRPAWNSSSIWYLPGRAHVGDQRRALG